MYNLFHRSALRRAAAQAAKDVGITEEAGSVAAKAATINHHSAMRDKIMAAFER